MGKRATTESKNILFPGYKSYSINDIIAAGGTTALANRLSKKPENISENLKKLPKDAFLTRKEAIDALEQLKE